MTTFCAGNVQDESHHTKKPRKPPEATEVTQKDYLKGFSLAKMGQLEQLGKTTKNNGNASTHIKSIEVHEFITILGMGKENMDAADR